MASKVSREDKILTKRKELEEKKEELERKVEDYKITQNKFIFAGLLILFYAAFIHNTDLVSGIFAEPRLTRVIIILFGILLLFFSIRYSPSSYLTELNSVCHDLELSDTTDWNPEEKAEELFDHHHKELSRYYDGNLMQSNKIFKLGVVSILASFVFIILTFYMLYLNIDRPASVNLIIASIGALSVILTDFIATVYIKMHADIVKSANEFHNRFVNTHHFYLTNYLVSKVKNTNKREDGLISLALGITNLGYLTTSPINVDTPSTEAESSETENTEQDTDPNTTNVNQIGIAKEIRSLFNLLQDGAISKEQYETQVKDLLQ
ncbi:hypothetical protein GPDM_03100 [Planococcus donghaensis MPA1U2]|uniref:Uncharacterized protein n=1 Tax=Planococcus donghaensis MPA1U2 TaxID=933115 RepID=E7RDU2_9BACL|nr:hypothetical protein [Planococcus donghaensis]EGA90848.1 hypothetical protein GPDM_03100 [Planococcus donghaensis MPA1U2]